MDNKFINYLITAPDVYYVYNRGSVIYGLNTKDFDVDFLVVVDPEWVLPEEYSEFRYENKRWRNIKFNVKYKGCDCIFFTTDEWFDKVMKGNIVAWECACLPKKFIHKEHVKLLMSTNPVQLRKDFDEWMELEYLVSSGYFQKQEYKEWKKSLWSIINKVKLVNQIIENHKIVNFKESNSEYNSLVNNDCIEEESIIELWISLIKEHITRLYKATDGMLAKEKQKKIIQNGK